MRETDPQRPYTTTFAAPTPPLSLLWVGLDVDDLAMPDEPQVIAADLRYLGQSADAWGAASIYQR
jgi:hypothetical protein